MTKITNTKPSKLQIVKSLAWLIEAAVRGFSGYLVLRQNIDNYLAVAVALYLLITAVVIVSIHFVHAHNK